MLGLRSQADPFDWLISDYWAVLNQIENDFQEFMMKDNLEVEEENSRRFRDIQYGFRFPHEIRVDFENEYEYIRNKYLRRIAKFRETIEHPTVFFRCIKDQEEIDYINYNWKYAEKLLKTFHEKNHIIYLHHTSLCNLTDNVESYRLGIPCYIGTFYEMRHMFVTSQELLNRCKGIISSQRIQDNMRYDNINNTNHAVAVYVNKCIDEDVDGLDDLILNLLKASREEGIYLWGAGKYGRTLAQYLSERNVKIHGIIDNYISSGEMSKFPIVPFRQIRDGAKIFIAIENKEMNEEIVKQVMSMHKKTVIIRFQDFINNQN